MQYRREIDGLRAVAVIAVILFHAGFAVFSGGFVGVDVFFVISGYLITGIIATELKQGEFNLFRFYERRARRILPALFFVMACCIPFAWVWMLPEQFQGFSQSLVAVSLFASNLYFWRGSGYFAPDAGLSPLQHSWSLAVEEQFYVIFPLILLLLWRFGRRSVFPALVLATSASILLSEWGWRNFPAANFYLAPTRAWEFLAGSICALFMLDRAQRTNNWLGVLGLALILFSIFHFDSSIPFPSLYTLAPVIGTALIILYGEGQTIVGRLLGTRILGGIGLISYSAYLWHQPLFAFARIRSILAPSPALLLFLVALTFGFSYLSWRFVEQPVRGRSVPSRALVFSFGGILGAAFIGFGLYGHYSNGIKWRMNKEIIDWVSPVPGAGPNRECNFTAPPRFDLHPIKPCLVAEDGTIDVVILGDSHSLFIAEAVQQYLEERGINSYAVSHSSCIPLPGFGFPGEKFAGLNASCSAFVADILEFMRQEEIPNLVLTSRFTKYYDGLPYDNAEGGVESGDPLPIDLIDDIEGNAKFDDTARRLRVLSAYSASIALLAGEFHVILVYPIPEAGWNVPLLMARKSLFGQRNQEISTSYAAFLERNGPVLDAFDRINLPNIVRVRPDRIFCDTELGRCANSLDGESLYYDDDHLSDAGALLIAPAIGKAVEHAMAEDK